MKRLLLSPCALLVSAALCGGEILTVTVTGTVTESQLSLDGTDPGFVGGTFSATFSYDGSVAPVGGFLDFAGNGSFSFSDGAETFSGDVVPEAGGDEIKVDKEDNFEFVVDSGTVFTNQSGPIYEHGKGTSTPLSPERFKVKIDNGTSFDSSDGVSATELETLFNTAATREFELKWDGHKFKGSVDSLSVVPEPSTVLPLGALLGFAALGIRRSWDPPAPSRGSQGGRGVSSYSISSNSTSKTSVSLGPITPPAPRSP